MLVHAGGGAIPGRPTAEPPAVNNPPESYRLPSEYIRPRKSRKTHKSQAASSINTVINIGSEVRGGDLSTSSQDTGGNTASSVAPSGGPNTTYLPPPKEQHSTIRDSLSTMESMLSTFVKGKINEKEINKLEKLRKSFIKNLRRGINNYSVWETIGIVLDDDDNENEFIAEMILSLSYADKLQLQSTLKEAYRNMFQKLFIATSEDNECN